MRSLGIIIFILGIVFGLALAFAAIWSDFEGFAYYNTGAGYGSFNGLACPILMTHSEKGIVTAAFKNPGSQEIEPYYEVSVSGPVSSGQFEGQLSLPPHSSKTIQWTVDASDIDLGFFIFVDLNILPVAGYSTREDTCGIMVLNFSGPSGGQVLGVTLAASLLAMMIGLGMWENSTNFNNSRAANQHRALQALGIVVLIALFMSFLGAWGAGVIFCAMSILLLVINLRLSIDG